MDKPIKPANLMPRSFGGLKENFSANLQETGVEPNVPVIYGGKNFNYQIDATGKEFEYCEKICDFINEIPIGKTITVDANNKLVYETLQTDITGKANISLDNLNNSGKARIAIKEYLISETYLKDDVVMVIINDEVKFFRSLTDNNIGNFVTDTDYWEEVVLGSSPIITAYPIGAPIPSFVESLDENEIWLDGASISKTTYAELYAVYGDKFGSTSTNFTLPDLRYRVLWGETVNNGGNYLSAGLPNITGSVERVVSIGGSSEPSTSGALSVSGFSYDNGFGTTGGGNNGHFTLNFRASSSNSIYGATNTVRPPSISVRWKTRYK